MLGFRLEYRAILEITGGATESIFPLVDKMLTSRTDYQLALQHVAARKRMENYRSMVDFLFCELFPNFKISCKRFYNGYGKPLRELISEQQREQFEKEMVQALETALRLHEKELKSSWVSFRKVAYEDFLKMAA